MKSTKLLLDSNSPTEPLVAFFEDDGRAGYLYLLDPRRADGDRIVAAASVYFGRTDLTPDDVGVIWDRDGLGVAVVIRGEIWAAIDSRTNTTYPGNYKIGTLPAIPSDVLRSFKVDL